MSSVLWFRRGLRLHDNPALLAALEGPGASASRKLTPVFILKPSEHCPGRYGAAKMRFLCESLSALDAALRKRKSKLVVLNGDDEVDVLKKYLKEWKADKLCFEAAPEPHIRKVDEQVATMAEKMGCEVTQSVSHLIWDHSEIEEMSEGRHITVYNSFRKLLERAGKPPGPVEDAPLTFPLPVEGAEGVGLPTLESLGYAEEQIAEIVSKFPGGEEEGLKRLHEEMARTSWVCAFEKPKTNPAALVPSTTVLSPYIATGCVSSRLVYAEVLKAYKKNGGKHSQPPVSLEGQLLWREFYYFAGSTIPNYDRMEGNPVCKQIPWTKDPVLFEAWRDGRTGYPWIDACMTQLRQQGWIHHLARHAVACFLTRGDYWVHWEMGRDVFDALLLDADWSLNNGNWMWLSASAFFHQYFRVYGPVSFGKKYDANGDYIRHFIPALKNMPKKYIFEPWNAPNDVQRQAGCVIGVDYPRPLVRHEDVSKALISRMADAYKANKEGKGSGLPPAKKKLKV